MDHFRSSLFAIIGFTVLLTAMTAQCEDHISNIDAVRTSMAATGSKLSEAIRTAQPENIRTLERVFEINNYALVTIESYLKMMKIFSLSGGYGREEIIKILNNWLSFIISYCASDMKYLEAEARQIKDKAVRDILAEEKDNITKLQDAARKGTVENLRIFVEK